MTPSWEQIEPLSVADPTGTIPRVLRPRLGPAEDPERRSRGLSFFCKNFRMRKAPDGMGWSAWPALPLLQSPADGVSSFRTRNRDSAAIPAKLDKLIRATPSH